MKVLVTGASGFIGKNLIASLHNFGYEVFAYDRSSSREELVAFTQRADVVVHLAGVNRPDNDEEFKSGNSDFTQHICDLLHNHNNKAPLILSSSIQATKDNAYGRSKCEAEAIVKRHAEQNQSEVIIYRFANLFGKWSKPNYNSVIATWCHNVSHGLPIKMDDPNVMLKLEYIDDVVHELIRGINGNPNFITDPFACVPISETVTLQRVFDLINAFKSSRINLMIPDVDDAFVRKLYSTYLSYLDIADLSYPLTMHQDTRGSFTEVLKSKRAGQISINVSKPGITKGNHWHHSKIEKFLVVKGQGVFKFRHILTDETIEYAVNDTQMKIVDIPPGYTHNIVNTGTDDLVTLIWVNEIFDKENPDTYSMEV